MSGGAHISGPVPGGLIFLGGLLGYVVAAVAFRFLKKSSPETWNPLAFGIQCALFMFACHYGLRAGAFSRDLVSPLWIAIGLVLGHAVFALSLGVTHQVWGDVAAHLFSLRELFAFLAEMPALIGRFLAVSFAEEVIYRAAAQPLLAAYTGRPWLSIAAVAVVFAVVHKHFFENTALQSAEFLGFSLLLGVLYHTVGSLSLVLAVHTVRNLESTFLEYLTKVQDLGGSARALAEMERLYARPFSRRGEKGVQPAPPAALR